MTEQFEVVFLGWPASGKTTFLSLLAHESKTPVSPEEADDKFKEHYNALRSGEPLEHTPTADRPDCSFCLENEQPDEPGLEVITHDYSGELTRDLCKGLRKTGYKAKEAQQLKDAVLDSDGLLFMVDAYKLHCEDGWNQWAESHAVPVLEFIKDVLSDKRKHPVMLLLTRTDLVEQKFVDKTLQQMQETSHQMGLGAEVMPFKAFQSKAGEVATCSGSPPPQFLAPDNDPEPSPNPEKVIRKLWRMHNRTAPLALTHYILYALILSAILMSGIYYMTRDVPVSAEDFEAAIDKAPLPTIPEGQARNLLGPLYVSPESEPRQPALSRALAVYMEEQENNKMQSDLRRAYIKYAKGVVLHYLGNDLHYRVEEQRWRPEEEAGFMQAYKDDLHRLNADDALAEIGRATKNKLDKSLQSVGSMTQEQLVELAEEYRYIDEPVPEKITDRITDLVYTECRNEVAQELDNYKGSREPEKFEKLYEKEIPRIINEALEQKEHLLPEEKQKLEETRDYLGTLRNTEKIDLKINYLIGKTPLDYTVAMEISSPTASYYYYPLDDGGVETNKKKKELPQKDMYEKKNPIGEGGKMSVPWTYNAKIRIDVISAGWRGDYSMVTWDSQKLKWSDDYRKKGYDLPGLTYLVFGAADDFFKDGDEVDNRFRLDLGDDGNLPELLSVPEFLVEANRRR